MEELTLGSLIEKGKQIDPRELANKVAMNTAEIRFDPVTRLYILHDECGHMIRMDQETYRNLERCLRGEMYG